MPLLHLVDRPGDTTRAIESRHGVGALVSGASHFVIALLLLLAFRAASDPIDMPSHSRLDPAKLIWMINPVDGGGRTGGGSQSSTPARTARTIGSADVTVPSAPTPQSTTAAVEPPPDMLAISARPMGDATQMLVGAIGSDSVTTALGPRNGAGGDGDGPDRGNGRGIGDGIGDAPRAGSPGVTTPIALQQVRPQYTADAMRAKVQGSVWLECVVLTDGSVGDVRVTRSLDSMFGLDQEAIAAARRWRFKPGTMNGKPVPVLISIELTFSLR